MTALDSIVVYGCIGSVFYVSADGDLSPRQSLALAALWPLALVAFVAFGIWMAAQRLRGGAR